MILYKMTHLPTGKFYIGSLQRATVWHRYKTSSKIVRPMMTANPEEWLKEILKQYPNDYNPTLLVDEEYDLIDEAVVEVGWEGIWNQRGSSNLGGSGYSPEARAKQVARAKNPEVIARAKKSKQAFIKANPNYFNEIGETLKQVWSTPEMREVASKRAIKQFANEENRQKASRIKKEYLANHPEDILKSIHGMEKARQDPKRELKRVRKIAQTMQANSEFYSNREKAKHEANPELGKQHSTRLKLLNLQEPERLVRMSESAKRKALNRPDLVAKSVEAMNSEESKAKMKATHLAKNGKWVAITFEDGEVIKILGANEAGRILGINKVRTKAHNRRLKKSIPCTTSEFLGKIVSKIEYISKEEKL